MLPIPIDRQHDISTMLDLFPLEGHNIGKVGSKSELLSLVRRVYPYHLFTLDSAQTTSIESILENISSSMPLHGVKSNPEASSSAVGPDVSSISPYSFTGVRAFSGASDSSSAKRDIVFKSNTYGRGDTLKLSDIILSVPCGSSNSNVSESNKSSLDLSPITHFHPNETHTSILTRMMQNHAAGYDVCVVGMKGCGKSLLAEQFGYHLGYIQPELICCYKDMTSRDLLQRRR